MSGESATTYHLRAATTCLRDIHENYDRLWRALSLEGRPSFDVLALTQEPGPDWIGVIFGAPDPGPPVDEPFRTFRERPEIKGSILNTAIPTARIGGEDIPASGIDFQIMTSGDDDWTLTGGPVATKALGVQQFFSATVAFDRGLFVTRFDVVRFAAYYLGYIHSGGVSYEEKNPEKVRFLTALQTGYPSLRRFAVDYFILTAARAVVDAADTKRFIEAATLGSA